MIRSLVRRSRMPQILQDQGPGESPPPGRSRSPPSPPHPAVPTATSFGYSHVTEPENEKGPGSSRRPALRDPYRMTSAGWPSLVLDGVSHHAREGADGQVGRRIRRGGEATPTAPFLLAPPGQGFHDHRLHAWGPDRVGRVGPLRPSPSTASQAEGPSPGVFRADDARDRSPDDGRPRAGGQDASGSPFQ